MALDVEDFVKAFHNLSGKSIGEKTKSFFQLLQSMPPDHDSVLAAMTPKTYLESLFRIKVILKAQNLPLLLEVLKSEHYLAVKLIKNRWFCQKLARHVGDNSTNCVSHILPHTSFIIRMRLLNILAVHGTGLDPLFDEIQNRYGMSVALNVLPSCSEAKIRKVFLNNKIKLSPKQVKVIYQKHPTLILDCDVHIEECVLKYIASHNISFFVKIMQKKCHKTDLGKRLTRKLLINFKEFVIENPSLFIASLHAKTAIKVLGSDFKQFFFNSFPRNFDDLRYWGRLDQFGPKLGSNLFKLLLEGVEKVYGKNLYGFPDLVSNDLMETMTLEERKKWVEIKNCEPIEFLQVSESIPLIKEKINVTSSINDRCDLVRLLVKTCKINCDLNTLAKVGEYVAFRHRNDDTSVLNSFIRELYDCFGLDCFHQEHWTSINSIIDVLIFKEERIPNSDEFSTHYLTFLFKRNQLQQEHIYNFLKNLRPHRSYNFKTNYKELNKILFLKSVECLPKLLDQGENIEYYDLDLINFIFDWNKNNPKDKLSFFDYSRLAQSLSNSIELAIKDDTYDRKLGKLKLVMESIICTSENSSFRDEVVKKYFLIDAKYSYYKIDYWLIKFQPETISTNFDSFLNHITRHDFLLLQIVDYIKKYSDVSLDKKAVEYCLKHVDQTGKDQHFVILAALMSAEDFLQFIARYHPENIEINSDKKKERLAISVAKSLKYTNNPAMLPICLRYCQGPLLSYFLESLYYLAYHVPEKLLRNVLDDLASKAVSMRKHAIFLTRDLGATSDFQQLLVRFKCTEKNISIQKHLFSAALRYFVKNPSDEFWELVDTLVKNVNKNDRESIGMLINLRSIPTQYQTRFFAASWNFVKNIGDPNRTSQLLIAVPSHVFSELSLGMLLEIISSNLLKEDSGLDSAVYNFTISALANSSYRDEVMNAIFCRIRECKTIDYERNSFKRISLFIDQFVGSSAIVESQQTLETFSERWHTMFTATEFIEEHLKLSFALLHIKSNKDLDKFSVAVAEFLENLESIYGIIVFDVFALILKDSVQCLFGQHILKMCMFFLQNFNNLIYYLLVIKLLPTKEPISQDTNKMFHDVINILKEVPHEAVQLLLNLYMKDLIKI